MVSFWIFEVLQTYKSIMNSAYTLHNTYIRVSLTLNYNFTDQSQFPPHRQWFLPKSSEPTILLIRLPNIEFFGLPVLEIIPYNHFWLQLNFYTQSLCNFKSHIIPWNALQTYKFVALEPDQCYSWDIAWQKYHR